MKLIDLESRHRDKVCKGQLNVHCHEREYFIVFVDEIGDIANVAFYIIERFAGGPKFN